MDWCGSNDDLWEEEEEIVGDEAAVRILADAAGTSDDVMPPRIFTMSEGANTYTSLPSASSAGSSLWSTEVNADATSATATEPDTELPE